MLADIPKASAAPGSPVRTATTSAAQAAQADDVPLRRQRLHRLQRQRRRRSATFAAALGLPWTWFALRSFLVESVDRRLDFLAIILPPVAMLFAAGSVGVCLALTLRSFLDSSSRTLHAAWVRSPGRIGRQSPLFLAASTALVAAVATVGPWLPTDGGTISGSGLQVVAVNAAHRSDEATTGTILDQDADVIVVSELDDELFTSLAARYPYHGTTGRVFEDADELDRSDPNNRAAVGVFSRLPVRPLPEPDGFPAGLPGVRLQLDTPDGAVVLYGVHLPKASPRDDSFSTTFDDQATVAHALLEAINREAAPVVLAGDLNISDRQVLFRDLTDDLRDAARADGWAGPTSVKQSLAWRTLLLRIDHILLAEQLCASDGGRFDVPGGDHRGVRARIGPCAA